MKRSTNTDKTYTTIVNNVKCLAEINHTSKPELAIILGVSERTIDNRFRGNVKTPFTLVELLKLCSFWDIPLGKLISPTCRDVSGLIGELEDTMSLLKKQIKMKGESR